MIRKGFVRLLLIIGILALGTTQAYASPDGTGEGDDLAYEYYNVRGSSNYMVVNGVTTLPTCKVSAPAGRQVFTYTPIQEPVVSCDPAKAKPLGVGSVAHGGAVVDVKVDIGPFENPVDVSIGIFAATFDAADIFFLNVFNQLTSLQEELLEESNIQGDAAQGNGNGQGPGPGQTKPKKKLKKLVAWKSNVLGVTETVLGPVDAGDVPPGLYVLVLNVTRVSPAADNSDRFYRWVTFFIVPDPQQ